MTITIISQERFDTLISTIEIQGEQFANNIHEAGLHAIAQANQHGNIGFATRLMDAIGKKHARERVKSWLIKFGKFTLKDRAIVYLKRADIKPENLDSWLEKADATPYWELTNEAEAKVTIDYLQIIKSAIEKAGKEAAKGKEVTEKHVEAKVELQALLERLNPTLAQA